MTTHLIFFFCLHDFNNPGHGVLVKSLLSCHSMGNSFQRINHTLPLAAQKFPPCTKSISDKGHTFQVAFPSRLLLLDVNKRMAFNAEPNVINSDPVELVLVSSRADFLVDLELQVQVRGRAPSHDAGFEQPVQGAWHLCRALLLQPARFSTCPQMRPALG